MLVGNERRHESNDRNIDEAIKDTDGSKASATDSRVRQALPFPRLRKNFVTSSVIEVLCKRKWFPVRRRCAMRQKMIDRKV